MRMSWNLKLVGKEAGGEEAAANANSDIGFAVVVHNKDGTLPMLLPYKY